MHRDHLVVQGAARTDSGVHARQQYVEFYSNRILNEETFVRAMNSMLPSSIVISALSPVENDFNVRFTNGKIYTYDIHLDKYRDPFTCRYRHVPKNPAELDIDAMREGCQSFVGLRDFRLLTNKTDRALESSERLIYQCKLGDIPGGIRVAVMGKGFLYKQVRNMVGVLIAVGYHKLDRDDISILLQGDETKLYNQKSQYQVAEGKGLCLQRVFLLDEQLPDSLFPV
jgi:tRNA pseudouridine38-40 synthase